MAYTPWNSMPQCLGWFFLVIMISWNNPSLIAWQQTLDMATKDPIHVSGIVSLMRMQCLGLNASWLISVRLSTGKGFMNFMGHVEHRRTISEHCQERLWKLVWISWIWIFILINVSFAQVPSSELTLIIEPVGLSSADEWGYLIITMQNLMWSWIVWAIGGLDLWFSLINLCIRIWATKLRIKKPLGHDIIYPIYPS